MAALAADLAARALASAGGPCVVPPPHSPSRVGCYPLALEFSQQCVGVSIVRYGSFHNTVWEVSPSGSEYLQIIFSQQNCKGCRLVSQCSFTNINQR